MSSPNIEPAVESTTQFEPASVQLQAHIGPLPTPTDLRDYEEAVPGTGYALVKAFTDQVNHRIKLEQRGQWHSFAVRVLILVVVCGVSITGIVAGYPYAGLGFAGGVLLLGNVLRLFDRKGNAVTNSD